MVAQVTSYVATHQEPQLQKAGVSSSASPIYRAAEKVWSYAGKSLLVTRHVLNGGLRSCLWYSIGGKEANGKIQTTITRLKLFSAVSIPFNAFSLSTHAEKIRQNFLKRDYEGIYLGLLTFSILFGDTIDSLATSVNAALETFASTSSQLISSVGLPLGFGIVSLGSLSRGIRLLHLFQNSSALDQAIQTSPSQFLKDLGLDDPQKLIALERHTTSGAANILKKLSQEPHDEKQVAETLKKIRDHLREEIAIQIAYIATNLLIFTALCLFFASVGSALPFVLLGGAWSGRLAIQYYQDFYQKLI